MEVGGLPVEEAVAMCHDGSTYRVVAARTVPITAQKRVKRARFWLAHPNLSFSPVYAIYLPVGYRDGVCQSAYALLAMVASPFPQVVNLL